MPLPGISQIKLNDDGSIAVTVEVYGFEAGTPIEISGYATQTSGAIATFSDVQAAPPRDSEDRAVLTVVAVPSQAGFNAGEAITVVVRAAQVGATVLEQNPEIEALWNAALVVSPLAGPPPGPSTGPVPPWWRGQDGEPEEDDGHTTSKPLPVTGADDSGDAPDQPYRSPVIGPSLEPVEGEGGDDDGEEEGGGDSHWFTDDVTAEEGDDDGEEEGGGDSHWFTDDVTAEGGDDDGEEEGGGDSHSFTSGDYAEAEKATGRLRERQAWPRLSCPAVVVVKEPFDLVVGLAGHEDPSVYGTGRLRLPAAEFELGIEIQANGFVILEGKRQFKIRVTHEDPFPVRVLRLAATVDRDFQERRIGALFTVDGELRGYAARDVSVVSNSDDASVVRLRISPPVGGHPARDLEALCRSGEVADLTVVIVKDAKQPTRLMWSAVSPHVELPQTPEVPASDLGDPASFLNEVVRQASAVFTVEHGFATLRGIGRQMAQQIPPRIQEAIQEVASRCHPAPPAILLATEDPYIPWELAVLNPPIGGAGGDSPFLGAQAIISRWPLPRQPPPPRCAPRSITVRDRAVVTGSYVGVEGWKRLVEAEEEAKSLLDTWPHAKKISASFREVQDCLRGQWPCVKPI